MQPGLLDTLRAVDQAIAGGFSPVNALRFIFHNGFGQSNESIELAFAEFRDTKVTAIFLWKLGMTPEQQSEWEKFNA